MIQPFSKLIKYLATIFLFLIHGCLPAQKLSATENIEDKIKALLQKMTLEEKIGQMNQYNGFWDVTGPVPNAGTNKIKYEHLKKGLVGSVLNVKGSENVRKLQELVVNGSRLGIPLLFGYDVIHGHKTIFPIPLGEAASWDLPSIQNSARISAIEASAVGINWTFAPMVDITRDPRWGRVMEGSGEDTYLGSAIGIARIKGFQGDDLSANNTIAASVKHLAGYGFAEAGRDYNTVDIGTSTLYNVILPPFKAAVENDVQIVMNSFNVLNGIPATANKFLQRDLLKTAWNFKGFIVSDWGSGVEMIDHGFAKNLEEVAELSTNAGSDMDMESYANITYLKGLVERGKVDIKLIDDAVSRILRVKFKLGLFDDPYRYCSAEREKILIYHPTHLAAAFDIAKKSIVLLKNDIPSGKQSKLLPLSKNQQGIGLIGALGADKNSPLGSWRIGSDDSSAISVLEGLRSINNNISFAKGTELITAPADFINEVKINETDSSGFTEAINLAKKSSIVIMVLGEHGFMSGEGRSRTKLGLPGLQQQLLEAVYKVNKNIVLVLLNGRPLTIPWAADNLPAIVEAWQPGTQAGHAVAAVLFGDYNPSGKLPMTFPRSVGQIPLYYNHLNTGRPGPKPEVFWSHYTDETNKPLYPFGFGLSYSSFSYSNLTIDASDNSKIKVNVTVKNNGNFDAEEVTQLYIRDKVASVVRPVKELKGFSKFLLKAGESKSIQFVLTHAELGFYNNEGVFIIEPGQFDIMVGTNSEEGITSTFTLK